MSSEIFDMTLERILTHCEAAHQRTVSLLFHGGEPTLMPVARFQQFCERARKFLTSIPNVSLAIQTNGTLVDDRWIDTFKEHEVHVGISLDGPPLLNDKFRIDHRGRGSYSRVLGAIERLCRADMDFDLLSVVSFGVDPVQIHRHLSSFTPRSISYLLPCFTHDNVEPIRQVYGSTPVADFLIPIFDYWWANQTIETRVREFWNIGRLIMGGQSEIDSLGNPPLRFIAIETDGSIEGLDKLRICEDGLTCTSLNVLDADFRDLASTNNLHAKIFAGLPLPTACRQCPEASTCAGGYIPHRYSRTEQFDNPSVWCLDLLAIFTHARKRLGISTEDTRKLRARYLALQHDAR